MAINRISWRPSTSGFESWSYRYLHPISLAVAAADIQGAARTGGGELRADGAGTPSHVELARTGVDGGDIGLVGIIEGQLPCDASR